MNNIDYNKIFEQTAAELKERKKLLLHACCAPCSTSVLERVTPFFEVTLYFFNPNIDTLTEFERRAKEMFKLKNMFNIADIIVVSYDNGLFLNTAKGHESDLEGGTRCGNCFELRLNETAKTARKNGFDLFTSTLTVSPHKNSALINGIGGSVSKRHGVPYLFSDFKKREGYKRSVTLSNELELYRQTYCGCAFGRTGEL